MAKVFITPFAASGDKTVIPVAAQPSGAVSYTEGFGLDYERNPETDPLAKRIPRDETNQLYYDLTSELGVMQLWGSPNWFPASDNEGVPVSYGVGAIVRHNGVRYESLVASNTAEPGTDPAKWGVVNPFNLSGVTATQGEVNGAVVSNKFVSPLTLASVIRTGSLSGGAATRVTTAYTLDLAGSFVLGARAAVEFTSPDASPAGPLTLNVDGSGARQLKTSTGGELAAGDLVAGRSYAVRYDGTDWLLVQSVASQFVSAGAASETVAGITRYATQGEANALTLNNVALTPARLPLASVTQVGVARAATGAEVTAGALANVFVSPATLANLTSTFVTAARTITAGVGLTGGGNLTADRTVAMGTPSAISASSTNSATGTTHTHTLSDLPISKVTGLQTALDDRARLNQVVRFDTINVGPNSQARIISNSGINGLVFGLGVGGADVYVVFGPDGKVDSLSNAFYNNGYRTWDSNTLPMATAAQYRQNASGSLPLTPAAVWTAASFVTLAQTATIAVDLSTGFNFATTMTGSRTLGTPSNTKPGQTVTIEFVQDATGGRGITWASGWLFAGGTKPTLSTLANARDVFTGIVLPNGSVYGSLAKAVS